MIEVRYNISLEKERLGFFCFTKFSEKFPDISGTFRSQNFLENDSVSSQSQSFVAG